MSLKDRASVMLMLNGTCPVLWFGGKYTSQTEDMTNKTNHIQISLKREKLQNVDLNKTTVK